MLNATPTARKLSVSTTGFLSGDEDAPTDSIPSWFKDITGTKPRDTAPGFAMTGREQFLRRVGTPWGLQDWLFQFDHEVDSRGWEWWDITSAGGDGVRIWVDSWGEPFYGCEDLRWLAYTAGARELKGPRIAPRTTWKAETETSVLE